jgi:hypothetical protein
VDRGSEEAMRQLHIGDGAYGWLSWTGSMGPPVGAVAPMTDQQPCGSIDPVRVYGILAFSRNVRDAITELTGNRDVGARLKRRYRIPHVNGAGLTLLNTSGPVLGRVFEFAASVTPRQILAVCSELIVPSRLPSPVAASVESAADALDFLLEAAGIDWHTTQVVLETSRPVVADASPYTVVVLRRMWIDTRSSTPCALISEELHLRELT